MNMMKQLFKINLIVLTLVLLSLMPRLAFSQTAQLIVNSPASVAGNYAAVTFASAPSAFTSTTPVVQGDLFVYDGMNCVTHTLIKPVTGSGAGKVAFLTGAAPSGCSYDDMVRELQNDGVVAVVFGFTGGSFRTSLGHANPTGLIAPVLNMQAESNATAIRSAVINGATVNVSFVALPEAAGKVSYLASMPGETRQTLVNLLPSKNQTIDYGSIDLDRTISGLQTSFITASCGGTQFTYSAQTRLITVTTSTSTSNFAGSCSKTYLVSDTLGNQYISNLYVLIGVPRVVNDYSWTTLNTAVTIDIMGNDIGDVTAKKINMIDLDTSTTAIEQSVTDTDGTWEIVNNALRFTPASGFTGTAKLNYQYAPVNNNGSYNSGLVTVYVGTTLPNYQGFNKAAREFYLPERDIYFRTADNAEADQVAKGAAGAWVETGNTIPVGGSAAMCRFYGNTNTNPATGNVYGPSSHFYTLDMGECEQLKNSYSATQKSWKFESLDFYGIPKSADGTCPANTRGVYRAYNNGFPIKDANHRYSTTLSDFNVLKLQGWTVEGTAFCVPA